MPETIWVISNISNSGKTTFAQAALKVLGDHAKTAMGFKPYAAGSLIALHDFALENYPKTEAKFYGYDSVALTSGSNVCDIEDAELVQPIAFVTYPEFSETFLVRIGSPAIGGRRLYVGKAYEQLRKRKDFPKFMEAAGMQEITSAPALDLQFRSIASLAPEIVESSFQHLVSKYQPDFAVIEGASGFLPQWKAGQLINHILLIQNHHLYFFPRINYVTTDPTDRLVRFNEIQKVFQTENNFQLELTFATANNRTKVAYALMEKLFKSGKIL